MLLTHIKPQSVNFKNESKWRFDREKASQLKHQALSTQLTERLRHSEAFSKLSTSGQRILIPYSPEAILFIHSLVCQKILIFHLFAHRTTQAFGVFKKSPQFTVPDYIDSSEISRHQGPKKENVFLLSV